MNQPADRLFANDEFVTSVGSPDQRVIRAEDIAFPKSNSPKIFEMEFDVYLKDTNAYGNVYFARQFEWQGMMREAWFSQRIFENMLELEGVFITKNAKIEYLSEVYPFQKVKGRLRSGNFRNAFFDLFFEFQNLSTGKIISKGTQTIVFANRNKRIAKVPTDILSAMKEYAKPLPSL